MQHLRLVAMAVLAGIALLVFGGEAAAEPPSHAARALQLLDLPVSPG